MLWRKRCSNASIKTSPGVNNDSNAAKSADQTGFIDPPRTFPEQTLKKSPQIGSNLQVGNLQSKSFKPHNPSVDTAYTSDGANLATAPNLSTHLTGGGSPFCETDLSGARCANKNVVCWSPSMVPVYLLF
jgi:hypothetical protein